MTLKQSVVEYPQRGPFGDARYRGNTTGYIIEDLINTFKPKTVLDPMEGSGTTRGVCTEYNLEYFGYDLKDGYDLRVPATHQQISRDMPNGADLIFWHPPYWKMIRYNDGDPRDLSSLPYDRFLSTCFQLLQTLRFFMSDHPSSRLALLMGDYRQQGRYYWITRDILTDVNLRRAKFAIDSIVIKKQHNVSSDKNEYSSNLIRINHEYLSILRPL